MTPEGMIETIQAFKEGKQIQYRDRGQETWEDTAAPAWNFEMFEYREKPEEPKEWIPLGYRADNYARDQLAKNKNIRHPKPVGQRVAEAWLEGYKACLKDQAS